MKEHSLQDQVVLFTGAGRVPAPGLAQAMAERGAIIAANDLSPTLLTPLVDAIQSRHGRIQTYIADATRGMPLRAMLDEVLSDWGEIHVLVNNPRIQPKAALLEMDEWDWQRTVEMNLNGPFLITQLVARLMREQGGGVIFNIVDANPGNIQAPGCSAYGASQQGLLALSQAAARELIAYNIRVYTLCPDEGILNSPGLADAEAAASTKPNDHKPFETTFTRFASFLSGPDAAQLAGQVFRVSADTVDPEPALPWENEPENRAG